MRLLAALLCATAYGQTVEGTVVNSVTGAPIAGVAVQIGSPGKPFQMATTDAVGAFRVDGLADGRYSASFNKQGFSPPGPDEAARQPFLVRAGSAAVRLQVRMTPRGKVSGRVLDGDGHPVPGAAVELMTATFNGQIGTAGGDGTFRFDVAPGSYSLSARPPQGLKPPESGADEKWGWVRTWSPGVIHASGAARIVVSPGGEIWGQDVRLIAVPVHAVRGIVRDEQGDPAPKQMVLATPTDELRPKDIETVSEQDGSFEFAGLHDGLWRISAESKSADLDLRGFLSVPVAGRDIERLDLRLSPPFSVTIHTTIETPDPKMEKPFAGVLLAPAVGGNVFPQSRAEGEGKLRLEPVYPGQYRVNPIRPSGPYYLASVTMGGRDIFGQYVELSSGALPIEVIYKSDGGTLRGSIENCGSAVIVMAPQERALRQQELFTTGRCTADGHFEVRNLRPADYYAFAFEKFDMTAVEFLASLDDQTLINRAQRVTVRANEGSRVELKVQ